MRDLPPGEGGRKEENRDAFNAIIGEDFVSCNRIFRTVDVRMSIMYVGFLLKFPN